MIRMVAGLACLAAVCLGAPALAEAATAPAKLKQTTVRVGDPALAAVNVHQKFVSVDSVCFAFTFSNDLLDPGDGLRITPLDLLPPLSGPGFFNPGPSSQATRTLCVIDPAFVSLF